MLTDNELNIAILHQVQQTLGTDVNGTTQWLHNTPKYDLDEHGRKIESLRKWAESIDDKRSRKFYIKWISFYQRGLNDAYRELETGEIKRRQDEFNRKLDRDFGWPPNPEDLKTIPTPPRNL